MSNDLLRSVASHAHRQPDAPALIHPDLSWSWAELHAQSQAARARLETQPAGNRIVIPARPAELIPVLVVAPSTGVCVVPLDPHLPPSEAAAREQRAVACTGPSPGVLVFTSGTTGPARAARLPMSALLTSARRVNETLDLRVGDAWLSALPLAHVGGLSVVLRCVLAGATMLLSDRFDPEHAADALAAGATHASFVARTLEKTLQALSPSSPLRCRAAMVGGGPCPTALLERAHDRGLPVVTTWGLTEACATVTLHRAGECPDADGSAGWPLPGSSIRVSSPTPDGAGVIEVSGPTLMEGYDDVEDQPITDGWLRTGDIGRIEPDGRLVVLDRRRDLIVSGGENVSPARVEALLGEHPAVDEVAVVGLPDPSWGQRVVAAVRLGSDAELNEIAEWACDRLTPAERPRELVAWPEPLPRTTAGKLRRDAVRAALLG